MAKSPGEEKQSTRGRPRSVPPQPSRKRLGQPDPSPGALAGKSRRAVEPTARPIVSCTDCGKCCTYVAIEIDGPNTLKRATLLLWYLYHERMSLYHDDGMWLVQFETRCRNLAMDLRCGAYPVRPHICREFSEKDCEVNSGDDGQTFSTPAQFLDYMREHRPRMHAKLADGFARPEDLFPITVPARRKLPLVAASMRLS